MAFTFNVTKSSTGESADFYNIDQSVGPGAKKGNDKVDIMLVQALFRIVHFEVNPVGFAPPPGKTSIKVDGILGPSTAAFITHWQAKMKAQNQKILIDGILDPFRKQGQESTIAHVRYALDLLNIACFNRCREQKRDNFTSLPNRDDIPAELKAALATRKQVARKYENEAVPA